MAKIQAIKITSQATVADLNRLRLSLASELPLLELRLRQAGLFGTANLVNKATQRIGYEIVERMNVGKEDGDA